MLNFGIIAEYNPFHNGHLYHILQSKEKTKSENCIVVMSGNFVQRGEPAVLDKYKRAKSALLNGAAMVIELPVPFATGSADVFAFGAINLLEQSNIIDYLCFGVETDNLDFMKQISDILISEPKEYKDYLVKEISKGISYPTARQNAIECYISKNKEQFSSFNCQDLSFLKTPNNILGLEYIKALRGLNSKIKPVAIKRKGNKFHSTEISSSLASATSIRALISDFKNKKISDFEFKKKIKLTIPENSIDLFLDSTLEIPDIENYMPVLDYILRTKSPDELSKIADVTEGVENRIIKFQSSKTISELLENIKTKRYTLTKLKHILIHIILDIKKSDIEPYMRTGVPYIRVLGFRKDKSHLLKELTEKSKVPVITNVKQAEKFLSDSAKLLLSKEIYSSNIYYMSTTKELNSDYLKPIVVI